MRKEKWPPDYSEPAGRAHDAAPERVGRGSDRSTLRSGAGGEVSAGAGADMTRSDWLFGLVEWREYANGLADS